MSSEVKQFKCVSKPKPNAITQNQDEAWTVQPTQLPPPKDSQSTPNPTNNDNLVNDGEVSILRFN
jgi:hypothetical protein